MRIGSDGGRIPLFNLSNAWLGPGASNRLSPGFSVAAVPLTVLSPGPPTKVSGPVVSVKMAKGLAPNQRRKKYRLGAAEACDYGHLGGRADAVQVAVFQPFNPARGKTLQ